MTENGRSSDMVSIVTGSARGIGKCIARALGREGARLYICDIDQEKGRSAESELRSLGITADFFHVDLSKKGAPQSMVRDIAQQAGRLDVLVNNARSGKRVSMMQEDCHTWDQTMAVTLDAAFFASQEAIRIMALGSGGSIVNVSSVAAFLSCHESPAYHAAKAGLLQLTRYLAVHAGPHGVRVNAVLPGFIVQPEHHPRYNRNDNRLYREIAEFCHPAGRVGNAQEVADAVVFLCSRKASFVTGQCLTVDGGLTVQEPSGLVYRFSEKQP